jgi:fucose permease
MKNNFSRSAPVFLAFLCMGFGDVVGPLTSQLQNEYSLSNFAAGLVTLMGFIMFGVLSVPMGIFQDRTGKKKVLILGLAAAFLGLVLPIVGNYSSFALLLAALLLLGTGATTLQVAGNPIMRDVSPEGKYSRNLSFGQFIKAIGSLSGALIPLFAIGYGKDWKILFPIYSIIILVTILYISSVKIEEKRSNTHTASLRSCFKLFRENSLVRFMVLGIFLYVGAEVCMSSKLPNYLEDRFQFDIKKLGLWGTSFFFLALMTGRFLGGVVLNWMKPGRFLQITALLSLAGIAGLYMATGTITGFLAIFIIGLGFANIFPLIFSITIDKLPERSNEISGLMVTAIVGGALVPVLFGAVADIMTLLVAFLVPAACILYVLYLSFRKTNGSPG